MWLGGGRAPSPNPHTLPNVHYVVEAHWFWDRTLKGLLLTARHKGEQEHRLWFGWQDAEYKRRRKFEEERRNRMLDESLARARERRPDLFV